MTGTIRLGTWLPFTATEWLHAERGFVWSARVGRGLVRITGSDGFVDGVGAMRWRLWGRVPVLSQTGDDVSRSAEWRFVGEALAWLPGALPTLHWRPGTEPSIAHAEVARSTGTHSHTVHATLEVDEAGAVRTIEGPRWGKPAHRPLAYHPFAVRMDDEITVSGVTVPSRLRAGWRAPSGMVEEFFRATVTDIRFDDDDSVTDALDLFLRSLR